VGLLFFAVCDCLGCREKYLPLQFNIQQLLMMRHTILFAILMMALNVSMNAQDADRMTESCTSIMVGKLASADGSVITSHTCDARYRT
jgi:hypothetical protein